MYSKWLIACARLSDESSDDDQVVEEKLDAGKRNSPAEFLALRPPVKWMIRVRIRSSERALEKEDRCGVRDQNGKCTRSPRSGPISSTLASPNPNHECVRYPLPISGGRSGTRKSRQLFPPEPRRPVCPQRLSFIRLNFSNHTANFRVTRSSGAGRQDRSKSDWHALSR